MLPLTNEQLFEPLGLPISNLRQYGGPNRTAAFAAVQAGLLDAYKVGRTTFITVASLRRLVAEATAAAKTP